MPSNNLFQNQEVQDRNSLRDAITLYLRNWPWFLLGVLLALLIAWVYLRYATPLYHTQASIVVRDGRAMRMSGGGNILSDMNMMGSMATASVDNEVEIIRSKRLMRKVVDDLDLNIRYFVEGKVSEGEIYGKQIPYKLRIISLKDSTGINLITRPENGKLRVISMKTQEDQLIQFNKIHNFSFGNVMFELNTSNIIYEEVSINVLNPQRMANSLQGGLLATIVGDFSTVIQLHINSAIPSKNEDVLNNLIRVYNEDAIEEKNMESQKTAEFVDDRLAIIMNELGDVEGTKEAFKESNEVTDLGVESGLNMQTIQTLRGQQLEVDTQLEMINMLASHVNSQQLGDILPNNIANAGVNQTISQYNSLVLERNRLLEGATLENPSVLEIDGQLSKLKSSIAESLGKQRTSLVTHSSEIGSEISRLSGRLSNVPRQERVYRDIERQQHIKENLYLLLLEKREEAAIALAITSPKAKIVDNAFTNPVPVFPKKNVFYLGAALFGILLPFGIIYTKELLKNKIESRRDLEKLAPEIPVIGEIPRHQDSDEYAVVTNELTPLSEAFRIIRTNLQYYFSHKGLRENKDGRVILVTSTIKSEGKTFVAMNMAHVFAQLSREKTILIGADIRNPQLQRYNRDAKKLAGLTEFLHDSSYQANEVIHRSVFDPKLDIIYSGAIPPNPSELLMSDRLGKLIEELKKMYDYIIIDTAPLLLVSDTLHISDFSDAVVYVIRARVSLKELIQHPVHEIQEGRLRNVNFVLNDVPFGDSRYAYRYGYKYGYQYGYNFEDPLSAKGWKKRIKRLFNS